MKKPWGYFLGAVNTTWISKHPRFMMISDHDVVYVDRCGYRWVAEKGRVINGAGGETRWLLIPWFVRCLLPAYVGMYRRASVVHDVACNQQDRSSKDVHRMFFEAMRCDGVGPKQAWIMWAFVRVFGPRFAAREPEQVAPPSSGTFR